MTQAAALRVARIASGREVAVGYMPPVRPVADSLLNGADVHVAEIIPITNPLQQVDLARVLHWTPYLRRPAVALAFLGIPKTRWANEAGVRVHTLQSWLTGEAAMPMGGALRLARVLGLTIEDLFEGYAS